MNILSNNEDFEKKLIFYNRLNKLVHEDGSHKSELPAKIGISNDTFNKVVNHGIIPTTKTLILIADYFEVSIDFLLNRINVDNYVCSTENSNFYERINELKKFHKIKSDYALAKLTLLPKQSLYDWRKFHYLPSIETLEVLSDYFKVSVDYLLARSDD